MMSTAIEFNNISKQYRLGLVSTKTLSHDLNRWWTTNIRGKEDPYLKIGEVNDRSTKGESDYVWALKDIDFKVEQGDVLGIIGKNGAGKSTLLKILSKVTAPTTGTIRAAGRIASLLEVGTGFHPEMTGRENIFMNGAIMGMTKREIAAKLDEIVDFSGVERYLDTPAKRYSSGMTVRLGFAIAAHLEPEILVVDEVLAVGDAEFQKKAIGKMQDVSKGEGRTVLFVSHNMASMQQLCTKGMLLENGMIKTTGEMKDVISFYQHRTTEIQALDIAKRTDRQGNGDLKVIDYQIKDENGYEVSNIVMGSCVIIEVYLLRRVGYTTTNLNITVGINDEFGKRIIVMSTLYTPISINFENDIIRIQFKVKKMPLNIGTYGMAFYIADNINLLDWIDNAGFITIDEGDFYNTGKVNRKGLGLFLVDYDVTQN
ncbi:MAG: ABC transporter ATP-binding protein [Paludibacter sp.]|nr:ABC transporter ATP-binding protein [Paludibacter sp.]